MRMLIALSMWLGAITACSIAAQDKSVLDVSSAKAEAIYAAEQAIEFCVREFERQSGRRVSQNIDRVTPLVAPEKIDMIFISGESGDFGPRRNYRPFFSCGLLRKKELVPYFLFDLEAGAFIPLIPYNDEEMQISELPYSEAVWHLLFLRNDAGFYFSKMKKFDPFEYENKQ